MNRVIIFMFVIVMCFSLKDCSGCALNILEFRNNLGPGHILKVNCTSNRNEIKGIQEIKFKDFYNFPVNERGKKRIVWRCHLRQGKYFNELWRAYRGGYMARCGQKREYVAQSDFIFIVKNNFLNTKQIHLWEVIK